jgi:hypothetical protein
MKVAEYLSHVKQIMLYMQQQSPSTYIDFVTRCWPHILEIEEARKQLEENKQQELLLNERIDRSTKTISHQKAVLGIRNSDPRLIGLLKSFRKAGLMTVPLITLFSISGILTILNPFSDPQKILGVTFIIFTSYSLTAVLSSTIAIVIHRNNEKNWKLRFWGRSLISWFVFLLIAVVGAEAVSGGFLAADLIDRGRETASSMGDTAFSPTTWYEKIELSLIMGLFAFVNVVSACAKGFELRQILPNQRSHDRASSQLKRDLDRLEILTAKNQSLAIRIQELQGKIAYPLEEAERKTRINELSNNNTLGKQFIGQHPGKYKTDIVNESDTSYSVQSESNGHKKLKKPRLFEMITPNIDSPGEDPW